MTQTSERIETVITKRVILDYLLHLPTGYSSNSDEKWPLILFLHGAGERGSDLNLVKLHGIAKVAETEPDFPFIAVSPQCPKRSSWTAETQALFLLLDHIESRYHVDKSRVYLTGLSMGGYGTWQLAAEEPERFAAIAPICGGGDPEYASRLKEIPTWVFHGAKDDVVPLYESVKMVEALRSVGGNPQFTVYPEAQHDSWTKTYDDPALYKWFSHNQRHQ